MSDAYTIDHISHMNHMCNVMQVWQEHDAKSICNNMGIHCRVNMQMSDAAIWISVTECTK